MVSNIVTCIIPTLNEEEHIETLIDSIFKQDFRPIEVLVVDGGSKDMTIELTRAKQKEMNSDLFAIKLLFEKDYGGISSPANARNIGVKYNKGEYIIFIDADIFLIEPNSVSIIKEKLDEVPFCCVRTKHIIDTNLEYQIALGDIWHIHIGAFRKEIFDKYKFNPELGLGDDEDFWFRAGVHFNNICEITLGRHFPHTIDEYKKQQIWYGKSYPNYLKVIIKEERKLFWKFIKIPLRNIFFLVVPIVLIVTIFLSLQIFFAVLLLLILVFSISLYRSPERTIQRLNFLIWRSFFEAYYFMYGISLYYAYKTNLGGNKR